MKSIIGGLLAAALVAACAPAVPSASPSSVTAGPPSSSPAASPVAAGSVEPGVPIPIVIDTDLGMDDLLAIYVLLRDPAVDVRAIAIDGTGLVHCAAGEQNLRRVLGAFDRLDIPIGCGRETPGPNGRSFPDAWRAGADDLFGVELPPVAAAGDSHDALVVLADAIAGSPTPPTIVALGTWTNLQDLLAANPTALDGVAGIHAMAGTIDAPGNIDLPPTTPADQVEWNVGADPDAFRAVLATDVPVTLVGLDATDRVPVSADVLARLEADHVAAGADIAYETYLRAPYLAAPGTYWWDPTAAVSLVDPTLLEWEDVTVSVTPEGPAAGRISRDPAGRPVRAATGADTGRVTDAILAGLRRGEPVVGSTATVESLRGTWDGAGCTFDDPLPTQAGLTTVEVVNTSAEPAGLLVAGIADPHTWDEALAFVSTMDLSDPGLAMPDWIVVPAEDGPFAEAGQTAAAAQTLPAGLVGVVCASGVWPDLQLVDGGSFVLAE